MSPLASTARSVSPPLTGSPLGFTGDAKLAPPLVDVQIGLPDGVMLPSALGAVTNSRPAPSMAMLGSPSPAEAGSLTGADTAGGLLPAPRCVVAAGASWAVSRTPRLAATTATPNRTGVDVAIIITSP